MREENAAWDSFHALEPASGDKYSSNVFVYTRDGECPHFSNPARGPTVLPELLLDSPLVDKGQ